MTESLVSADEHENAKTRKPPNRKKYEEETENCSSLLHNKEAEIKSGRQNEKKSQSELEQLKTDKTANTERWQTVNNDLTKINQDICKQEAQLARIQSSLQYRSEAKINEALHRLQSQLRRQNFRLSEEKKIVAEIDTLNRCRRDLGAFLTAKKQLDEKRTQARALRDQRDKLYKEGTALKRRDEQLRKELVRERDCINTLQNECTELRRKLRSLHSEFNEQEKLYEEQRRRHAAQHQQAKKLERKSSSAADDHPRQSVEAKTVHEPCQDRRTLCSTLIKYLQVFVETSDNAADFQEQAGPQSCPTMDGMFRLPGKKADLLDETVSNVSRPRTNRKMRKDRRKLTVKLTPDVFTQFAELGLTAPLCHADISVTICQLIEMQEQLSQNAECFDTSNNHLTLSPAAAAATMMSDTNATPSSAASFTCSVPTTPDVQPSDVDGAHYLTSTHDTSMSLSSTPLPTPLTPAQHHRRNPSSDSGTCELDEVANRLADQKIPSGCDEQCSDGSDVHMMLATA